MATSSSSSETAEQLVAETRASKKASLGLCLLLLCSILRQTLAEDYSDADVVSLESSVVEENHEKEKFLGVIPEFDSPSAKLTVVAGHTAILPCFIENLGNFKVAWLEAHSVPLTYEERRVIDDSRYSIVRPQVKDWNLLIRDVRKEDAGDYLCTINTYPVRTKLVTLYVIVPAQIIAEWSSEDIAVEERSNFNLTCNVTGVPFPQVTWHRKPFAMTEAEAKDHCELGTSTSDRIMIGQTISIANVSRNCSGNYLCTAFNQVSPPVSRQIRVTVEFAPSVRLSNPRISQSMGRETILECEITALPHAVNFWEKDGRRVTNSEKHRIDAYEDGADDSSHRLTLSLRIHITHPDDYGHYKCIASNSLGRDEKTMILYEQRPMVWETTAVKNLREVKAATLNSVTSAYRATTRRRTLGEDDLGQSDRQRGNKSATISSRYPYMLSSQRQISQVTITQELQKWLYGSDDSQCCRESKLRHSAYVVSFEK